MGVHLGGKAVESVDLEMRESVSDRIANTWDMLHRHMKFVFCCDKV